MNKFKEYLVLLDLNNVQEVSYYRVWDDIYEKVLKKLLKLSSTPFLFQIFFHNVTKE